LTKIKEEIFKKSKEKKNSVLSLFSLVFLFWKQEFDQRYKIILDFLFIYMILNWIRNV